MAIAKRFSRRTILWAGACVAAASLAGAPMAGLAQESAWQGVLRLQLLAEQNCQLNFLTNIFEGKLDGQDVITAKAQCVDGRQFDVKREQAHEKFYIKACAPTYC